MQEALLRLWTAGVLRRALSESPWMSGSGWPGSTTQACELDLGRVSPHRDAQGTRIVSALSQITPWIHQYGATLPPKSFWCGFVHGMFIAHPTCGKERDRPQFRSGDMGGTRGECAYAASQRRSIAEARPAVTSDNPNRRRALLGCRSRACQCCKAE